MGVRDFPHGLVAVMHGFRVSKLLGKEYRVRDACPHVLVTAKHDLPEQNLRVSKLLGQEYCVRDACPNFVVHGLGRLYL